MGGLCGHTEPRSCWDRTKSQMGASPAAWPGVSENAHPSASGPEDTASPGLGLGLSTAAWPCSPDVDTDVSLCEQALAHSSLSSGTPACPSPPSALCPLLQPCPCPVPSAAALCLSSWH